MKNFCPNCEKDTEQETINKVSEINVRGELIKIDLNYYLCKECGEDYEIPHPDYDPVNLAFREFRRRKGMLQPEEIKEFRNELGLTQRELSEILRIGIASVNRYENGALQSEGHDRSIRLIMDNNNLIQLINSSPKILPEEVHQRLLKRIQDKRMDDGHLFREFIEKFESYSSNLYSGYMKFSIYKYMRVIQFFCSKENGVFKTKLNKLLFYADFKHFKDFGVSITGSRYANAPFGPIPHKYATWLAVLSEWNKEISLEERLCGQESEEVFISEEPKISDFTASELSVLLNIEEIFSKWSSTKIHDYSINEKGYLSTKNGDLISYEYAKDLSI